METLNKELRQAIVEEMRHFCYICHKRFFLMCGTPQIKVGGCCCGVEWGKTLYVRPIYAHLHCYHKEKLKRTHGIMKEATLKKIMVGYCAKEIRNIDKGLQADLDPIQKDFLRADKCKYELWWKELR